MEWAGWEYVGSWSSTDSSFEHGVCETYKHEPSADRNLTILGGPAAIAQQIEGPWPAGVDAA